MTKPHVRDDPNPSRNVMAHGDALELKWRGTWRMEWVASTLHTTSQHDVSSITTADAHILTASSRLNWRPRRFKWTRPFRRKTKSGFCACANTFQLASTANCILPKEFPRPTADYFFVLISMFSMGVYDVTSSTTSRTSLEQIPSWEKKGYSRRSSEIFLPFMVTEGLLLSELMFAWPINVSV
jgi:hypothetical protein